MVKLRDNGVYTVSLPFSEMQGRLTALSTPEVGDTIEFQTGKRSLRHLRAFHYGVECFGTFDDTGCSKCRGQVPSTIHGHNWGWDN